MLAFHGQGRYDRVPAGDLGYLKLVGRITTGHPKARATEDEVREFFAPYGEWKGLAGEYLRWPPRPAGCSRQSCSSALRGSSPSPGRNSFVSTRSAACGCVSSSSSTIQSM